jgi:hypothetical protein
MDKDKKQNNNEQFINADDTQINSLIHYSAAEDNGEDIEKIDEYINKNASIVVASIENQYEASADPVIEGQMSLFDDETEAADKVASELGDVGFDKTAEDTENTGFDKNGFLKNAMAQTLGLDKTASVSSYTANTIGGLGAGGVSYAQRPYSSPMLTLSDMKMPKTTTEFFKWCKYYYTFDPLISGAINACSTFPVTDIYLEDSASNQVTDAQTADEDDVQQTESDELKLYKRVLLKNIGLVDLCILIGIDYHLYGNCFIFGEFKTGADGKAEWKNVIRLDPNRVVIDFNPVTQEKRFRWQVPESVQKICRDKKPLDAYNKIPDIIKQAVEQNKTILLNSKHIYHFARPTDSGGDNAVWGVPIIAHVLKLITYRNVLRQAQEAIAREHIVPMRVFYVQPQQQGYNATTDWSNVSSNLAGLIARSVRDPNFKVVSPVPVGLLNVGGEGKQLLLTPEIEQIQSEILAGMNVPREFIFGGVSYSGTSISLRILENQFITYRLKLLDFINDFLIRGMAEERGDWTSEKDDDRLISAKMVEMKMVDDVQQKQLILDLNARGKVTDEYMWKAMGLDPDKIKTGLEKEAMDQIKKNERIQKAQIDSQIAIEKYQMECRKAAGLDDGNNPNGNNPNGNLDGQNGNLQMPQQENMTNEQAQQVPSEQAQMPVQEQQIENAPQEVQEPPQDPQEVAIDAPTGNVTERLYATAREILKLPKQQRESMISAYPVTTQQKIQEVISILEQEQDNNNRSVDMRPMPEQRPPRRAGY